jgi:hypothetical protein
MEQTLLTITTAQLFKPIFLLSLTTSPGPQAVNRTVENF